MSLLRVIQQREGGGGRVYTGGTSRIAEFWRFFGGEGRGVGVGLGSVEVVVIRWSNRNPSPGRSGRTLHPAASLRQSVGGDKSG